MCSIPRGGSVDNVLIGWRWGELALGPYALAYRLFYLPVQQLTQPLGQVMVPALAQLRDQPERYVRWYTSVVRLISYVAMPPLIAVGICAHDFVNVLVGPQWDAAGDILRWLAPIGATHVGYTSIGWLMLSTGRADRHFGWATIVIPICIVSFLIGLPWGAEGVAIAYMCANMLLIVPGVLWACRGTPVRPPNVFKSLVPAVVAAGLTALGTLAINYSMTQWAPVWRLAAVGSPYSWDWQEVRLSCLDPKQFDRQRCVCVAR